VIFCSEQTWGAELLKPGRVELRGDVGAVGFIVGAVGFIARAVEVSPVTGNLAVPPKNRPRV
jgi:hypothetical protein